VDALTGQVATRDGRTLAYLEVGDPHGPLVLHNHGGPSSRFGVTGWSRPEKLGAQ
jgi:hypothetical protein